MAEFAIDNTSPCYVISSRDELHPFHNGHLLEEVARTDVATIVWMLSEYVCMCVCSSPSVNAYVNTRFYA